MSQLLDQLIKRLFLKGVRYGDKRHLLSLGFRSADDRRDAGSATFTDRSGIVSEHTNGMVTRLTHSAEWALLLTRIGNDLMSSLLLNTAVFVPIKPSQGCYHQLCGEPLSAIPRPRSGVDVGFKLSKTPRIVRFLTAVELPLHSPQQKRARDEDVTLTASRQQGFKRLKTDDAQDPVSSRTDQPRTPTEVLVHRGKVLRWRRTHDKETHLPVFGLSPSHPLNADQDELFEFVLLRTIFPRQFRIANAFTSEEDPNGRGSSHDRRAEILKAREQIRQAVPERRSRKGKIKEAEPGIPSYPIGFCQTPRRLRTCLPWLRQMHQRHLKIDYKRLLDRCCPRTVAGRKQGCTVMSRESKPTTNPSVTTQLDDHPFATARMTSDASKSVLLKAPNARHTDNAIPTWQVKRFISRALAELLPVELLGGNSNVRRLQCRISALVYARLNQRFNLAFFLEGLRTTDLDWGFPQDTAARQQRGTASDSIKRQELLAELVLWICDSIVIDLLRTNFYATESSGYLQQRTLYYRHDDWQKLCSGLTTDFTRELLTPLTKQDILRLARDENFACSDVRFVPKKSGMRPIVNLSSSRTLTYTRPASVCRSSRGPWLVRAQTSLNTKLRSAFRVLLLERSQKPASLGAGVLSNNDIYTKLVAYRQSIQTADGSLPFVFVVKTDFESAYDKMDQGKLMQLLAEFVSGDRYTISRSSAVRPSSGKAQKRYVDSAYRQDLEPQQADRIDAFAETVRHGIFIDGVVQIKETRKQVLQVLQRHICNNIVRFGSRFYRQTRGIPQGSVVSVILAHLLYGNLENTELPFVRKPGNTLLRYLDDSLFLTTSRADAERYLRVMEQGSESHGAYIGPDKTLINFDMLQRDGVTSVPKLAVGEGLIWCGLRIDVRTLTVQPSTQLLRTTRAADSIKVDRIGHQGRALLQSLLGTLKQRTHILFNDSNLNGDHGVLSNLYTSFVMAAMRFHAIVRMWKPRKGHDASFFCRILDQLVRFTFVSARSRAQVGFAVAAGANCNVRFHEVEWIAYKAFCDVLSQRPTRYTVMLQGMRSFMRTAKSQAIAHRLSSIVGTPATEYLLQTRC
ncbi:hypothetical protein E5Q_01825 [Mixia osmundae IAM 14324]|uniref:Telomerase reverse transcriptase n=1 Tax=Mixia osmundae (strain CBS 9802 / IAM 14324 / JCM 22182 / KY 12970) TaxID=764103 RepID=G7DX60_MIXOS|nr:hypothetical protein E5Q_01825 [Mixia osmundae IAM 14324]